MTPIKAPDVSAAVAALKTLAAQLPTEPHRLDTGGPMPGHLRVDVFVDTCRLRLTMPAHRTAVLDRAELLKKQAAAINNRSTANAREVWSASAPDRVPGGGTGFSWGTASGMAVDELVEYARLCGKEIIHTVGKTDAFDNILRESRPLGDDLWSGWLPCTETGKPLWSVTHAPSGMRVVSGDTRKDAEKKLTKELRKRLPPVIARTDCTFQERKRQEYSR